MSDGARDPAGTSTPARGGRRARGSLTRRVAALGAATALMSLVVCDVWVASLRRWLDQHSFTNNVLASLLVLAVTALIFDEVIARRQRREKAVSVAVQGLIVYGQARRSYDAVVAAVKDASAGPGVERPGGNGPGGDGGGNGPGGNGRGAARPGGDGGGDDGGPQAGDEMRSLANMLLTASPALFDDPEARLFLEEVERLAASLYLVVAQLARGAERPAGGDERLGLLEEGRSRMAARVKPLAARLPTPDARLGEL